MLLRFGVARNLVIAEAVSFAERADTQSRFVAVSAVIFQQ